MPWRPGTSARSTTDRSRAQVPDSWTIVHAASGRSSVALIAQRTVATAVPPFVIRIDRATTATLAKIVVDRVTMMPLGASRRSISRVSASSSAST